MTIESAFSAQVLELDCARQTENITATLRNLVSRTFKRRGLVVALSGGIDSSVVGALCVRALGKDRVLGLLMPEKDSAPETLLLSRLIAERLQIKTAHEDITGILEAVGCYRRRDAAIKSVIAEYGPEYKCKIVLPSVTENDKYRL